VLLDEIDRNKVEYEQGCERRRQVVLRAFKSRALASIRLNPDCQRILDAYIVGTTELVEVMPLLRLALGQDTRLRGKAILPDFLEMLLADIRAD
jgi:hypothetical protein